jgi:hypothetical protein
MKYTSYVGVTVSTLGFLLYTQASIIGPPVNQTVARLVSNYSHPSVSALHMHAKLKSLALLPNEACTLIVDYLKNRYTCVRYSMINLHRATQLEYSPDARRLAILGDSQLVVVENEHGKEDCKLSLAKHAWDANFVWHADSNRIIWTARGVGVYDVNKKRRIEPINMPYSDSGLTAVTDMSRNLSGMLFAFSYVGGIIVCNIVNNGKGQRFEGASRIAFDPLSNTFALAFHDHTIQVAQTEPSYSSRTLDTFVDDDASHNCNVAYTPCGSKLIACSGSSMVVWDRIDRTTMTDLLMAQIPLPQELIVLMVEYIGWIDATFDWVLSRRFARQHDGNVSKIVITPNQQRACLLRLGTNESTIVDLNLCRVVKKLPGPMRDVVYAPDSDEMAAIRYHGRERILLVGNADGVFDQVLIRGVWQIAYHPFCAGKLAAIDENGVLRIFERNDCLVD